MYLAIREAECSMQCRCCSATSLCLSPPTKKKKKRGSEAKQSNNCRTSQCLKNPRRKCGPTEVGCAHAADAQGCTLGGQNVAGSASRTGARRHTKTKAQTAMRVTTVLGNAIKLTREAPLLLRWGKSNKLLIANFSML